MTLQERTQIDLTENIVVDDTKMSDSFAGFLLNDFKLPASKNVHYLFNSKTT